ncbi:MAG: NAD-dependent epimerase/dehydratase family protein, partial [bacterium]
MSTVDVPSSPDPSNSSKRSLSRQYMARILILGCGRLGRPLGNLLIQNGHHVIGIRRSPPPDHAGDIEWHTLDIRNSHEVTTLPLDVQQLIVILTPAARAPEGYRSIYQQGMENVLTYFEQSPPTPACIFVSATSVYAQQMGQWVNEDSETKPLSYNGQSLL